MSVNKVILLGNLGNDIEVVNFENGGKIGKFSIATNESYTDKQTGEKVAKTEWHNCVARNKTAEVLEKYVKKGDQIYVEGKNTNRKYQTSTGENRYINEVIVLTFSFVGKSNQGGQQAEVHQAEVVPNANEEDDLPF